MLSLIPHPPGAGGRDAVRHRAVHGPPQGAAVLHGAADRGRLRQVQQQLWLRAGGTKVEPGRYMLLRGHSSVQQQLRASCR